MDKTQKIMKLIPKIIWNKYLNSTLLFIFWITFLDDYNLIHQNRIKNNLDKLKTQKEFYLSAIKSDSTELSKLKTDNKEQEKLAREKFLMKKENEDIFIIREKKDE